MSGGAAGVVGAAAAPGPAGPAGPAGCEPDDGAQERVRRGRLEVLEECDVCPRHDQHVPVGERLHVEEGHHLGLAG